MGGYDNSYSRLVAWLKILLPLVALAILATLFLFARRFETDDSVRFAELEELARDERIVAPTYSGVTDDGAAIRLMAQSARPLAGEAGRLQAEGIDGVLDTPDGVRTAIVAGAGDIDTGGEVAHLSGGVMLDSSAGYLMRTDALTTTFDVTALETEGAVAATGPFGELEAGRMSLKADAEGRYHIVFNEGVRLVYAPEQE